MWLIEIQSSRSKNGQKLKRKIGKFILMIVDFHSLIKNW